MVEADTEMAILDSASSPGVKYGIDLRRKIVTCVLKKHDVGI